MENQDNSIKRLLYGVLVLLALLLIIGLAQTYYVATDVPVVKQNEEGDREHEKGNERAEQEHDRETEHRDNEQKVNQ